MSKQNYITPSKWQQYDTSRTSSSVIVHATNPLSPTSSPRLRLNDLMKRKINNGNKPQAEELPKASPPHQFPYTQVKKYARNQNILPSKFLDLPADKQKKGHSPFMPKSNSGIFNQQREGGLTSCRSEKTIPSFLRNGGKVIQKNKNFILAKENFKIIKRLGQGRFGTVFMARQISSNFIVALKVMNKRKIVEDNLLGQLIRQLKIQSYLDHPNIIRCYGYFSDHQNFYALLELACDGQLFDFISTGQTLSEDSTSYIIGSLLDAISLMHQHKILHRDIKPENVVLSHGNVKLCDFGWAVNKKQELRSTFCGTPLYLSPEILKGQKYDEKVDLWAIGILAYELHLGCSPFDINEHEDLQKIVTDEVHYSQKVSREFRQFIEKILKKNPKQRLSCQDLLSLEFIRKYQQLQCCEELCK